jgi:Phage integrase, N-terminal SAM-like domain
VREHAQHTATRSRAPPNSKSAAALLDNNAHLMHKPCFGEQEASEFRRGFSRQGCYPHANASNPLSPRKLHDQVRDRLRVLHYSIRTGKAYVDWIRRYTIFHGKSHPGETGGREVEAFQTALPVDRHVVAAAQSVPAC